VVSAASFSVPYEALFDRTMWLRRAQGRSALANFPARFSTSGTPTFLNASSGVRLFSIGDRLACRSADSGKAFNYTTLDPDANVWTVEASGPGMTDISPCASDGTIVTCFDISSGQGRYTNDFGATWNGISGGVNNVTAVGYVRSNLWIAATSDKEFMSTDFLGGWVVTALSGSAPNYNADTPVPFEIVSNGVDTSLILATGTDYIPREVNLTRSEAQVTGGNIAGGAWNATLGTFAVVSTSGASFFSSNGAAWTAGPNFGGSITARSRVVAHGRHFACVRDGKLFVFDSSGGEEINLVLGGPDGTWGITELYRHGDRIVAGYIDPNDDLTYSFSLREVL
jgi:hypothetical protein